MSKWTRTVPIPEDSVLAVVVRDTARARGVRITPEQWQDVLTEAYWREVDIVARIDKAMNEAAPILIPVPPGTAVFP